MNRKLLLLFSTLAIACSSPSKKEASSAETSPPQAAEQVQIAPLKVGAPITEIAFGSCEHQKQPQPIWNAILAAHPDLYVGMGDNVYASKAEDQPISEQYRLQAQVPEFKKFRAEVPIIATWDDHDAGENDGGASNPKLAEAKTDFLNFFPYDAREIPSTRKGVFHSFLFGNNFKRVQVLLLDTRTYRAELEKNPHPKNPLDIYKPTQDTHKTFLGEEQWAWLEEELKKPAEVRFIISSVQLIPDEHSFEKWGNFPHERKRFFDLLKSTHAKNVVILSGDRHMAEISQMNVPGVGNVYDVTSSGINRVSNIQTEKNSHRVGEIYAHENFGLAKIDWDKRDVAIEIHGLNGEKVQEVHQKIELFKRSSGIQH